MATAEEAVNDFSIIGDLHVIYSCNTALSSRMRPICWEGNSIWWIDLNLMLSSLRLLGVMTLRKLRLWRWPLIFQAYLNCIFLLDLDNGCWCKWTSCDDQLLSSSIQILYRIQQFGSAIEITLETSDINLYTHTTLDSPNYCEAWASSERTQT